MLFRSSLVALALVTIVALSTLPRPADALPPAGTDVLKASGQVSVESRLGTETIALNGSVTVHRGTPHLDGGVDVVDTEIVAMQLAGQSVTGPVTAQQSPTLASTGQLRSQQSSPNDFPADSFFDVFAEISAPSSPSPTIVLRNTVPLHMTSTQQATAWPPFQLTYQSDPSCVPLMPTLPADICIVSVSLTVYGDSDRDGCSDAQELGPNEMLGGRRNPNNPWDFYDIDGDHTITLPGDILAVAAAFGPANGANYAPAKDRTPPPAPGTDPNDPANLEPWDMGPPDGVINIPTDILGVAQQFGHTC